MLSGHGAERLPRIHTMLGQVNRPSSTGAPQVLHFPVIITSPYLPGESPPGMDDPAPD